MDWYNHTAYKRFVDTDTEERGKEYVEYVVCVV